MVDNALLTEQKKAILRGEVDMGKYADPENEIYKIRSMVNTRRESLVEEISLLQENGHEDLVDHLLNRLFEEFGSVTDPNLRHRVRRLRRDIELLDREVGEIQDLRSRLEDIEEELDATKSGQ